ncbi:FBD-associated F-box protein At1g61320 [Capsella rubella]|uniref:FBD-associated F-box protein At1g61320 n=1 Tax=Capsella rubella TaxID=81985 RepID=UPI000CD4A0C9|nr:FBD-associated F-box protein At1g61320 [Capsella rubella]
MTKSSNKQMKYFYNLPEDLVVRVSSFLPIKSLSKNRVVSKLFRHAQIRSLDLDFSGISSVTQNQSDAINIIQNVFNKHEGSEINRFVLCLKEIGGEESITSWINTCIGKNIQEIVLDFSKSKDVMEISIDFSAIETLTVLNLRWCKFEIPNNSPKGLKLLRSLSLMRTNVTKEMINAIFTNCNDLEFLELIDCSMYGLLSIPAQNHKKFKSLVVSSMPYLMDIVSCAPTLEYFKYDGYVTNVIFLRTDALKEANLNYTRYRRIYDSSEIVVSNMKHYTKVYVLTTTNIFLEALTKRYVGGRRLERKGTFKFENLTDFKIFFKAPTLCTLFDIVEFLKNCPKLKRVVIDIQNFTFAHRLEFWQIHHKEEIENNNSHLMFLNEVKIIGYKGHWHELDIVEFFVKNAPSLVKLELQMPKNAKTKVHAPDYGRINFIKSIFPAIKVTEV